jgi:hypothetical protein
MSMWILFGAISVVIIVLFSAFSSWVLKMIEAGKQPEETK